MNERVIQAIGVSSPDGMRGQSKASCRTGAKSALRRWSGEQSCSFRRSPKREYPSCRVPCKYTICHPDFTGLEVENYTGKASACRKPEILRHNTMSQNFTAF